MRVAVVLAVITATASACGVFDLGPPVTCQSVAAEDCVRAVEMARPLLAGYVEQATEVRVHPGSCSQSRGCSARRNTDPGFITVELVSEQPEAAYVIIDRNDAEWLATCLVTVPDANGAHGGPC